MSRISQDEQEFQNIIRGIWRKNLIDMIKWGRIPIPTGKGGITIQVPWIEIPHIRFREWPPNADVGDSEVDAGPDVDVGQGPGKPGTDLGPVHKEPGEDDKDGRRAGTGRGHDFVNVDVDLDDFVKVVFEELLELPRIKPKGERSITSEELKYTDISRVGPDSLRHKRRTLKEALKRTITEGKHDPKNPKIIPIRDDFRYRRAEPVLKKRHSAVVFYMMDVSGSMEEEDREVVRYFCWLTELWLRYNYGQVETVYIIHDGEANEVDQENFFRTERAGGTQASSAHKLALEIVEERYPAERWNIYTCYFSDGFNFNTDDPVCLELIRDQFLPIVNLYAYGEVAVRTRGIEDLEDDEDREVVEKRFSPAGNFGIMLQEELGDHLLVKGVNLETMEGVPEAIKAMFAGGN